MIRLTYAETVARLKSRPKRGRPSNHMRDMQRFKATLAEDKAMRDALERSGGVFMDREGLR